MRPGAGPQNHSKSLCHSFLYSSRGWGVPGKRLLLLFWGFLFFLTLHFLAPLPTPQYIRPKTTSSLWCCGGELRKEDRKQKWGFLPQFQHSGHVLFFRSTHCTSGLEELTTLLLPPLHNQQTRKPNILGFPIHPHFPAYRGSSSPLIGEQILLKVGVLSVRIDHSSGSGHF